MSAVLADKKDRDAIETALDETLIVEAAAGTGKTTELVRRIIKIIESGRAEVSKIVAVTFTEKAAGELKLRLREALEEARRKARASSVARKHLDERLAISKSADQHDSWLRRPSSAERPVEALVDPLFTVLTEDRGSVCDEAFRRWMEDQARRSPRRVRRSLLAAELQRLRAQAEFDDGPIGGISRAGWELIQWRDFDGGGRASHSIAGRESMRWPCS
jgi:superfamily I DNA/RNA helicase